MSLHIAASPPPTTSKDFLPADLASPNSQTGTGSVISQNWLNQPNKRLGSERNSGRLICIFLSPGTTIAKIMPIALPPDLRRSLPFNSLPIREQQSRFAKV